MADTVVMDFRCIQGSRGGVPHGHLLANGVTIVWQSPTSCNNIATEAQARQNFPNLVILSAGTPEPVAVPGAMRLLE